MSGIVRQVWDLIAFTVMKVFGLMAGRPEALKTPPGRKIQRTPVRGDIHLSHLHSNCELRLGSLAWLVCIAILPLTKIYYCEVPIPQISFSLCRGTEAGMNLLLSQAWRFLWAASSMAGPRESCLWICTSHHFCMLFFWPQCPQKHSVCWALCHKSSLKKIQVESSSVEHSAEQFCSVEHSFRQHGYWNDHWRGGDLFVLSLKAGKASTHMW